MVFPVVLFISCHSSATYLPPVHSVSFLLSPLPPFLLPSSASLSFYVFSSIFLSTSSSSCFCDVDGVSKYLIWPTLHGERALQLRSQRCGGAGRVNYRWVDGDWIIKRNRGRWDCFWAIRQLSWYSCSIHLQGGMMVCVCVSLYIHMHYVCALKHPRLMIVQAWAGRLTLTVCFASCLPTAKSDGHTDRTACLLDVFKWLQWIGWIIDGDCMCFLCLQCDRERWRGMGLSKAITSKLSLTAQ